MSDASRTPRRLAAWPFILSTAALAALAVGAAWYAYSWRRAALEAEGRWQKAVADLRDRLELDDMQEEMARAGGERRASQAECRDAEARLEQFRLMMDMEPPHVLNEPEFAKDVRQREAELEAAAAPARQRRDRAEAAFNEARGRLGPRIDDLRARHPDW